MSRVEAEREVEHLLAQDAFYLRMGVPAQYLGAREPRAEAHRALPDVHESIDHARICRDWLRGTT